MKQTFDLNRDAFPHKHYYPQVWLLITSFSVFGFLVVWDLGLLRTVVALDRSYVTSIIFGLLVLSTCHAAWHIFKYSVQIESLRDSPTIGINGVAENKPAGNAAAVSQHTLHRPRINTPVSSQAHTTRSDASEDDSRQELTYAGNPQNAAEHRARLENSIEIAAERYRSPVDLGWFLVDLAIRLGLVGTIIGFILIFTSLTSVSIDGADGLKELMIAMSGGMGTALFTTLGGLIAGTIMSFQYLILGRQTEHLIGAIVSRSVTEELD